MSVRLMAEVFARYPVGGGEMLLALALADHAADDGTRIYPSIKNLAEKTRQSERTVQYQLRAMEEAGWLLLVNAGHGGRSMTREYAISPEWIKGADIAPISKQKAPRQKPIKGANPAPINLEKGADSAPITGGKGATGCTVSPSERVQSDAQKGATDDRKGCNGLHPQITISNHQETIKHKPMTTADAVVVGIADAITTGATAALSEDDTDGQQGKTTGHSPTSGEPRPAGEGREGRSGQVVAMPSRPNCPHDEIIALYHEILPTGRQVRIWTDTRRKHLASRWRENRKHQSLAFWKALFEHIARSPFLTGQTNSPGRPPFQVSLDFIVNPTRFAEIIEGKYHRDAGENQG